MKKEEKGHFLTRDRVDKINDVMYIICGLIALYGYITHPELRWLYHDMIIVFVSAMIAFTIVFCPLLIFMAIFVPIFWVVDKIKRRKSCNQTE